MDRARPLWLACKQGWKLAKWSLAAGRPATEGVLDPYTPHIEVPEGISSKDSPAEDLPYYFGIIQAMEAAEVASCSSFQPIQYSLHHVLLNTPAARSAG